MRPYAAQGPIDVFAYDDRGKLFFFDAKKMTFRVTNKRGKRPTLIHRPLTEVQKKLGVRTAYVDLVTRNIKIVPKLPRDF